MASGFTPEAAVLDLGPRRPREHGNRASWEYILWPCWSYRVVAPLAGVRKLDMFQRAVLGLCRAGRQDSGSLGRLLSIHRDLAAFILADLTGRGFVDGDGLTTDSGAGALDEDTVDVRDMVAGHVFQDPWTGELWPRFAERLTYCRLEHDRRGFPDLLLGSGERTWIQGAFMVLPDGIQLPTRPSPAGVVSAAEGHRRRARREDSLSEWEDEPEEAGRPPSAAHFDRVSIIGEEPDPVFLMTYLYITEDSMDSGEWHACDPFGLGESVRLRRGVERVMQELPGLRKVVSRMAGRVGNSVPDERKRQERLQTAAALEVEGRLSADIRNHGTFDRILDMEIARREAALLGPDCPGYKIDTARRACLKCLEAVFGDMARKHPLGDVWKRVYVPQGRPGTGIGLAQQQDRMWLEATYRSAAAAVGFAEPVPESLLGVRPGHIRSVAEHDQQWRLRPLVTASILAAQTDPLHPLRAAAEAAPGLLRDIDEIARQGGRAGHAAENGEAVADLSTTVDLTYGIVSVLTGFAAEDGADQVNET